MESGTPVLKGGSKRTLENVISSPKSKLEMLSMLNLNSELEKRNSRQQNPYELLIVTPASKNLIKDLGSKSKFTHSRVKGVITNPSSSNNFKRIEKKEASLKEDNLSFYLTMLDKYQVLNQPKTSKVLKSSYPALETDDDVLKIKHEGLSPISNFKARIVPNDSSKKTMAVRETSKFIGKSDCAPVINGSSKSPSRLKSYHLVHVTEENFKTKGSSSKTKIERSIIAKPNQQGHQISQNQESNHSNTIKSKNSKSHKKGGFSFLCCF